jgi:YVTN family beta-propeller protein
MKPNNCVSLLGIFLALLISAGCGGGSTSPINNSSNNSGGSGESVAASVADTIPTGQPGSPFVVAVDSSSNKIYVLNNGSGTTTNICGTYRNPGSLTVIDGASDNPTANAAGYQPVAVAIDSTNHAAYVVSAALITAGSVKYGNCSVPPMLTTIDGATLARSSINLSFIYLTPTALAVNPLTNTEYVTVDKLVGVIAANSITPVSDPSAINPAAVAVDSRTNKVYLANEGSNSVSVIDGGTNSVTAVADPNAASPAAVGINSTSNKIYVVNKSSNNVSVIDGATDSITTITDSNAVAPVAVAVNATTNTIYVANSQSNNVTVIDGATGSVKGTIAVGTSPSGLDVDVQTNFIYVTNAGNAQAGDPGNITVIDGATSATQTLSDPNAKNPVAVAVNPTTNKIYIANSGSNNVTVMAGAHD